VLAVIFAIQGAGVGVAMPSATSSVMDVLPRERAGAGSALTNTSRQVGVALGVAVLGSILAQAYRSQLQPSLSALPPAVRTAASQSIAATQATAQHLGAAGHNLLAPADAAFTSAMHLTTVVAALIALAGALVVLRWMPGLRRAEDVPVAAGDLPADHGELAVEHAGVEG
jgi:MFS family permease